MASIIRVKTCYSFILFKLFNRVYLDLVTILAPAECVLCKKSKTKSSGSGYEVLAKCTIASAETLLQVASNLNNDLREVKFTGKSFSEIIVGGILLSPLM